MTWPAPDQIPTPGQAPEQDTTAQGLAALGFLAFIASVWVRSGAFTALFWAFVILTSLSITLSIHKRRRK